MAYNRWLSSQYSYSPGYDLMHYGRKGMRWGKHIFGLPEITLNGGGGGAVDLEELKKMLEQGKITLDEFKARAEKHFQSVAEVNKDGLKQVQDKFSEYMKKVQDTYENFKAGDGSNKDPEVSNRKRLDSHVVDRVDPLGYHRLPGDKTETKKRKTIEGRFDYKQRDPKTGEPKFYERSTAEVESAENRNRMHSKIQDRKGQESRDRKENLERKRAERSSAPRTVSKSSNQNAAPKTSSSKDSYTLEDVVKLAFSSASSGSSSKTSTGSSRTPNQNKEPKKEEYDVTAKQRKIYQTIGKFLNYALTVANPYRSTVNGLKKTVKATKR